ncbi:hypothetical protein [Pseudomonas sp. NBRC 111129]|uniref:hypothetical protein n=1 Tax=Pseudomonas sp. NBRC 111129 TaxID=1661044 RepID=UPI0006D3BC75|nr:hypothetical protein [Pseudomonas sp. NBRC 111129]
MNMKNLAYQAIFALLATFSLNALAGDAASKAPIELEVSGALFYENLLITSFAETISSGTPLEANAITNSRYFAEANQVISPEKYDHGFKISVSPLLLFDSLNSTDSVHVKVKVVGSTVTNFLAPTSRSAGIGKPQMSLLTFETNEMVIAGKESVVNFDCAYVDINDEKPKPMNCVYHLLLTINKRKA